MGMIRTITATNRDILLNQEKDRLKITGHIIHKKIIVRKKLTEMFHHHYSS